LKILFFAFFWPRTISPHCPSPKSFQWWIMMMMMIFWRQKWKFILCRPRHPRRTSFRTFRPINLNQFWIGSDTFRARKKTFEKVLTHFLKAKNVLTMTRLTNIFEIVLPDGIFAKNTNFGIFKKFLEYKCLVYFNAIWYNL
jgi:hypothetical protein